MKPLIKSVKYLLRKSAVSFTVIELKNIHVGKVLVANIDDVFKDLYACFAWE